MGNAVAGAIGMGAFLMGWSIGGPVAALLFGAFMGGMSWVAFGWDSTGKKSVQLAASPPPTNSNAVAPPSLGNFFLRSSGNEAISPSQYGYWSVRWSADNASGVIEDMFRKNPNTHATFARCFQENEFPAHMQFMALHTAAYWAYATFVLGVSAEVVEKMKTGLEDGLKDLLTPKGEPYSKDLLELFKASFSQYYKSMQTDFTSDADPRAFNPDVNELAKCALGIFSKLYPKLNKSGTDELADAQLVIERMSFCHMVADLPMDLFKALKENLGLGFVAAPMR